MVDAMTAQTASEALVSPREDVPMKWFFGGQTWMRATSESTNGAYGLIEQVRAPGTGSPYHLHHNEDESFYILEGSIRFVSGDQSWTGGPGTYAFLPRHVPHGFEVVGDTDAHYLLMVTPGGFDAFVTGLWTDEQAHPIWKRSCWTVPALVWKFLAHCQNNEVGEILR